MKKFFENKDIVYFKRVTLFLFLFNYFFFTKYKARVISVYNQKEVMSFS